MYGLVYMYAGDYLAHHNIKKQISICCVLLGLALSVFEVIAIVNYSHKPYEGANYAFPTLGALLMTIGLFIWLKGVDTKAYQIKHFISFLGSNALGIYIFHMLLMALSGDILKEYGLLSYRISAVLLAIVYTILSALISDLIRKTPLNFLLKL